MCSTVPGVCDVVQFYYRPSLPLLRKKGILCLMLLIQEVAIGALCSMVTQTCSRKVQWSIQCCRNNSKCGLPSSERSGSHSCFKEGVKKNQSHT